MSIHKSLRPKDRLRRHRNVLTRSERIEKLMGEEKWTEDESVFGLPKVKQQKAHRTHKEKKVEETPEAAEGVEAGAEEGQEEAKT